MKKRYIINKEKRTIVCLLEDCERMLWQDACKHFPMIVLGWGYTPDITLEKTYRGVAKCNPNDEWDEELGKKLACDRAYNALRTEYKLKAKKFINCLNSHISAYETSLSNRGIL